MIPSTMVDWMQKPHLNCWELIDMEDCDDVQNVYHNGEISDEVWLTLKVSFIFPIRNIYESDLRGMMKNVSSAQIS